MTEPEQDFVFYHALYHLVTHWAAAVAILVLLLTIGVALASAQSGPSNKGFFILGISITAGMALYFLCRMYQFGNTVNTYLPASYDNGPMLFPHPWNLVIGAVLVLVITAADIWLVKGNSRKA